VSETPRRAPAPRLTVLVGLALVVSLAFAFPPWPDDWDGLGFLASITHFDLASFAPHPPGYPVYVALLKLAATVTTSPIGAARVVGVACGLVTFAALCIRSLSLPREALMAAAVCAAPLVFHAFSGVGSEAPALACVAVAGVGLLSPRPARSPRVRALLVGLGVGLGLGVRLSWAPFYLPLLVLLPRRLRLRGLVVAALACLAWAIPLIIVTGPAKLEALARAHLTGHMSVWGGTAITEPTRVRFLARDLFVDGFGVGADPLGFGIAIVLAWATVASLSLWVSRTTPGERLASAARAALLTLPYLAWVTFGQNLRQQPRHVLPLVLVAAWALACAARAAFAGPSPRSLRIVLPLLAALLVTRTAIDATARRAIPPAGAQVLAYVREHADVAMSVLFTGASGRFLDGTEWQPRTHPAGTLSDAWLALTHEHAVPGVVLVTSEVTGIDESSVPHTEVGTFCRPARLDRRMPCLHLYAFAGRDALSH